MAMKSGQWLTVTLLLSAAMMAVAAKEAGPSRAEPTGYPPYGMDKPYHKPAYRHADYDFHPGDYGYDKKKGCAAVNPGLILCGTDCVDPETSEACCGANTPNGGTTCKGGQICHGGVCECPPGETFCPNLKLCVKLGSDKYCGTSCTSFVGCTGDFVCDTTVTPPGCKCKPGTTPCPAENPTYCFPGDTCPSCPACTCQSLFPGVNTDNCGNGCADLDNSNDNCGSCGNSCLGETLCDQGDCLCPSGKPPCSDGSCADPCTPPSDTCPNGSPPTDANLSDPANCGKPGGTCQACSGSLPSCINGVCSPCKNTGSANGQCANNQECCQCRCDATQGFCKGNGGDTSCRP